MSPALGLVRPEALPLLAAVAAVAVLAVWAELHRRRALLVFAGRGAEMASMSWTRRRVKLALALGAAIAAVVALAGPYVDVVERTVAQSGVDLVVALDVSQSMAVRDIDPDRLRAAKQFVARLGDGLAQSRVALVLFAGRGVLRYPPTADAKVLGEALDSVTSGLKPQQGGSSLAAAVVASLDAFTEEARESTRRKAVVLVTDGEETVGLAPDLDQLRERNIRLFAIGVGTVPGGPIPTYDNLGRFAGYLRRPDGTQVVSRSPEEPLRSFAQRTEGRYWRLDPGFQTVNELRTELMRLDAAQLGEVQRGTVPDDRYQAFLALALMALIAAELVSDRRRMPLPRGLRARGPIAGSAVAPLALLVVAAAVTGSCAQLSATDADRLYLAGDHQGALVRYRDLLRDRPEVVELHVNAGNALHRLGEHPAALDEYGFGIRDGEPGVQAVAQYQRGNTLFRIGKFEEAREAYKAALRVAPGDRDAKFNIEVIHRILGTTTVIQPGGQAPTGSGPPGPGEGQPGQPPPGQSAPPGGEQGQPGTQGPQGSGPPTSTSQGETREDLVEALRDFRARLTPEEALRVLDALLNEQEGIEVFLEGTQQPPQLRQDPTY